MAHALRVDVEDNLPQEASCSSLLSYVDVSLAKSITDGYKTDRETFPRLASSLMTQENAAVRELPR